MKQVGTNKKYASVFELDGVPKFKQAIPLALQHVVAMIVGCVTPAIMVAGKAGVDNSEKVILVQAALLIAGIATLLQLFPIRGVGSGLPVVMGVSFAYVPTLLAIAGDFDIPTIFGAQIAGGVAAVFVGIFIKKLRPLFPPLVTGTVVFTIGLSLYPTAINYMAGGTAATTFPEYGHPLNWLVAFITLGVVIFLNHYTKGFMKLASILIGMVVGYIVAACLGMVNFNSVAGAGWFTLPKPMHFGIKFELTTIISMVIMYVVNSVQAIGDLSATTAGGLGRVPTDKELSGGIIGNGVTSIVGAFFGGLPTATYSQNVGIVNVTKVVNRCVIGLAAVVILIAGFIPKFSSLLTTIPQCVLGGATISVFASITMTGVKLIFTQEMNARNSAIVGISVALGIGITQVPAALNMFPAWVGTVFGKSAVVIATLTAIFFNLILPKEEEKKE